MNKDIIRGNWKVVKGKLKQKWAQLNEDDILQMEGTHDELSGILQKKYGYKKDQAKREIDNFIDQHGLSA